MHASPICAYLWEIDSSCNIHLFSNFLSSCEAALDRPAADEHRYAHFLSPPRHAQLLSGTVVPAVFFAVYVHEHEVYARLYDSEYAIQPRFGRRNRSAFIWLTE